MLRFFDDSKSKYNWVGTGAVVSPRHPQPNIRCNDQHLPLMHGKALMEI